MTDTLTHTNQKIINDYPPGIVEKALRTLNLGTFLSCLSAPVMEELTLDASLQATLTKTPIGPVAAVASSDGGVAKDAPLQQVTSSSTPAGTNDTFHVNPTTRVITCGSYGGGTALASGDKVKVVYLGITADTDGGSQLATDLASTYNL